MGLKDEIAELARQISEITPKVSEDDDNCPYYREKVALEDRLWTLEDELEDRCKP